VLSPQESNLKKLKKQPKLEEQPNIQSMGGFSVWEKVVSEPVSPNNIMDRECAKEETQVISNRDSPTASHRYLKTTEDEKVAYRKKVIKIREEGRSDTAANETVKRASFFSIASRFENLDRVANLHSKFIEKHEHIHIKKEDI
jgi:hypothetical protein